MAGTGLLALLDDIATLLDDVALLTKVAAKKTAGVLGDDLALNAEQVSGVRAERELPVVWAVAVGSAKNKLILVPLALLLSAFLPWLITPLLMLGGAYLCFEGAEKILHKLLPHNEGHSEADKLLAELKDPHFDLVAFEKEKIKGAIRTDFILSAEVVVISLGTVQHVELSQQILVVSLIAAAITIGVYGLVAGIVKLDDLGLYLIKREIDGVVPRINRVLGTAILNFCPYLMKTLSVVGTAAMFLVGGGILLHGFSAAHYIEEAFFKLPWMDVVPAIISSTILSAVVGVVVGIILVLLISPVSKVIKGI